MSSRPSGAPPRPAPTGAPRDSLQASFDRAAPGYLKNADSPAQLAGWLAEWLPARREGRALEIGAGPGVFTERLLPWRGEFVATDLSAAMCAAGRARVPQVRWRTMAAERPSAGPWDWIFSSGMLQWSDAPSEVFSAWRRELAPGGRVLAALFAAGSLREWTGVAGAWTPLRWRTPEQWRLAVGDSGLRLVRDEAQERAFEYPSSRDFLRRLHAMGAAPRRRLGPGALRRLLDDYQRRCGGGGRVTATWVLYRFEALVG